MDFQIFHQFGFGLKFVVPLKKKEKEKRKTVFTALVKFYSFICNIPFNFLKAKKFLQVEGIFVFIRTFEIHVDLTLLDNTCNMQHLFSI